RRDGALRGRILAEAGMAALGGERAEVDDAAPALCLHQGQDGAHRPPRPLETRAERHVELLVGDRLQRATWAEAVRIVHQDVDRAVETHRLLDHRFHVAPLADVDDGGHALATLGADLLRGALSAVELQLGDADAGTLASEDQGDGPADALAGARDDRDLAVETAHLAFPSALGPPPSRSVEPAIEGPGAPLVGQDRVLDGLADAPLDRRGDAALLHQLQRLVAVLSLRIGVHLEVLHLDAVMLPESLVERLGISAPTRGALARIAERAQRLLVGTAAVVEKRVHGADRLRHRDVAPHLLVRDLEGAGVLDLHQHVIRVTQV